MGTMDETTNRIRMRALLIGLIGGLWICSFTPFNNLYLRASLLGGGHFPLAPFFIVAWLTFFSACVSMVFKRVRLLTGLELFTSWILMVVVSGIPFTGLMRTFLSNLTAPLYFADEGNRWEEVLQPLLPQGLYPSDPAAVELLYDGIPNGLGMDLTEILANIPWGAWAGPMLWWGVFVLLSYFLMICMVNILGRQWVVNERLNFPLLRVPQVMAEAHEENRFFQDFLLDRYLLIGLLIPFLLHLQNGLAAYYPAVPEFPTVFYLGNYFPKTGLFSGFYKLRIYFFPAFIGFAFLCSRQVSFSLWSFFILGALVLGGMDAAGFRLPPAALGPAFGPTLSRVEEMQMAGAYLVFFCFIIWLARQHLSDVLQNAVGAKEMAPSQAEWFSLRASFWGGVFAFVGLVAWCVLFGMSMLTAVITLVAFFVVSLVASRVICQGGIAYFTLTAAPLDGVLAMFGGGIFAKASILLAGVAQKVLFVDMRESLMPSLFHASKVGEGVRNKRFFVAALGITILAGLVVSFVAMMVLCYQYGLRELELSWATRTSINVYDNIQRVIEAPDYDRGYVITFGLIGAAIMTTLVVCYHRFYWWPLHPIGYLAAYSSSMRILWFSFLIGWLCNQLVLRYGGVDAYKRVRFLFFGLILGDFLMGGMWALIGHFTGVSYMALPD